MKDIDWDKVFNVLVAIPMIVSLWTLVIFFILALVKSF